MLDAIIKGLRNHSTKLWLLLTAGILTAVYKYLPISFIPSILPLITLDRWVQLSLLLLILVIALAILLRVRCNDICRIAESHKNETKKLTKLKLKYGIYWDKDKNPFCKKCKKPLSAFYKIKTYGRTMYKCRSCGAFNEIAIDGLIMDFEKIKDRI